MKKTAALVLTGLFLIATLSYAEEGAAPAPAPPADKIDISKYRPGQDYVTLNFNNIDIAALIKVMSELTRKNFIIDERVTGKVTLMTPTKISPDEAYQVFLSALEIKGFTAVEDGRVVRIIPTASARQSGLKVVPDGDLRGQGYVTKLIRMTFVNPQDIVRTLTPLMSKDGNLIAYPATNSLIVTDSVHNIKKIESLLRALDVAAPEGKGKINVFYLKYANAEDTAKVMSALLARIPAPGGAQQPGGPSTILEGLVTITADKATNSLIVVGSPIDYETVKDVIQKLDIRRRQVYVEAAIVEMSLAKARELGFEFQALNPIKENQLTAAGGTNFGNIGNVITGGPAGLKDLNGLTVGAVKGTFEFNGIKFLNVGALLRALQVDGDVNVLSTPNILTTDNQKAEIMVGENIPFITGQSQSTATGGGAILTSIERKDVGITLKLTPQITSDDNVRLDIYQEISAVTETAGINPNLLGPSTSKRSASTTVVVKDRETMVIGGLIRDNVTSSTQKVPLLGDIPLLGWLFKYKKSTVEKTNLMIFITPYIIKNETEAAELTKKKGETMEQFRQEHRIEKKDTSGLPESSKPGMPSQSTEKPRSAEKKDTSGLPEPSKPAAPSQPPEKPGTDVVVPPSPPAGETPVPAEGVR